MGQHILVIEDSAPIRRLVEICLRDVGPTIITAADGPSGLQSAVTNPPALIVLDIGLPGLDGWEVLAQLRSDSNTVGIRVLVLTAHAQPEMADRAAAGGADAFMTKPFRPNDLRESVEALLNSNAESVPAER